ncbi:MAG: universal stress protein [Planctomycetes bacterium]|nr:universal stress protein [Planctomycetota bacterium]
MSECVALLLDGSPEAEAAVPWVERLGCRGARVILVYAARVPAMRSLEDVPLLAAMREEAEGALECLSRRLGGEGIQVRGVIRTGRPIRAVADAAEEAGASLIVVSARNRRRIAREMRWSRSRAILAIHPEGMWRGDVRRILVPLGASVSSLAILPVARKLARLLRAKLLLFHAVGDGPADVAMSLNAIAGRLRSEGVSAEAVLSEGPPARAIVRAVSCRGADLIAMSTRGRRGLARWGRGSVTEEVLRKGKVPVLMMCGMPGHAGWSALRRAL